MKDLDQDRIFHTIWQDHGHHVTLPQAQTLESSGHLESLLSHLAMTEDLPSEATHEGRQVSDGVMMIPDIVTVGDLRDSDVTP